MRTAILILAALSAASPALAESDVAKRPCAPLARLSFDRLITQSEPISEWAFDHGDKTSNGCAIVQTIQSVCQKHRDWTIGQAWAALQAGTVQGEQRHMCGA